MAVSRELDTATRTGTPGEFVRGRYVFRDRITADGSSGYRASAGRYHLYVSHACPWSQRTAIVRRLKGLEEVVGLTVVDPIRDERGWAFTERPDPVNGFVFLSEAYLATDPGYEGRWTVPVLWDTETERIVSNHFGDITIMLGTEFEAHTTGDADLYPGSMRNDIDALNAQLYVDVNNGVYRAGFAKSQEAYDEAVEGVFAGLERMEERLERNRYLFGSSITEADVRLWVTLVRFDVVYHHHFRCNRRRIVDMPNLWAYARDLYATRGFGDTTDFDHIRRHYYLTHPELNPSGIVPTGPELDWDAPHDREYLRGGP